MARQPFRCYSALRNRRIERSLAEPALLASPSFLASSSGAGRAAACALTTRTASIVPLRFARRFRVLRHVRGEGVHGKALSRHADVPDRADDLAAGLRCACQGSVQHAGAAGRSTERALWPTRHTAPRSVLAHLRRGGQKSAGAATALALRGARLARLCRRASVRPVRPLRAGGHQRDARHLRRRARACATAAAYRPGAAQRAMPSTTRHGPVQLTLTRPPSLRVTGASVCTGSPPRQPACCHGVCSTACIPACALVVASAAERPRGGCAAY